MIALLCFLTLFAAPFKSKSRLEAENAALRHQLIVLQRRVRVASSSQMGIACSWSCCIDGFHRSSRPSRSSGRRPLCAGIGPASGDIGNGNPAPLEVDRRFRPAHSTLLPHNLHALVESCDQNMPGEIAWGIGNVSLGRFPSHYSRLDAPPLST